MAYDRQRIEAWLERERALAERGISRRQDPNRKTAGQTPVTAGQGRGRNRRRRGRA